MSKTATPEERLQRLDDDLEGLKEQVLSDVAAARESGGLDNAYEDRFDVTFNRLSNLNDELHPEDFDPEALAEIRNVIIRWLQSHEALQEAGSLDRADKFIVSAEAIRHLIRDALDAHVGGADDDAQTVMATLHDWLPTVSQVQLAELLGASTRSLLRWRQDGGTPSRRLQLVARLVAILRRGWSEEGVVAWFYRPRPDLDGKRPIDVLDDAGQERALGMAARQGRAQHGT